MGGAKARTVRGKREARTARRRDQTRDEILDVARMVVLRDGFRSFTTAAVASELGLTNPALYYYFNSKEVLLFELVLREWLAAAEQVEKAVARTTNGADAIEALLRTLFERYHTNLDMFMLVHQSMGEIEAGKMPEDHLPRLRPINDMLYGGAEARLRVDQEAGLFPANRNPRRFVFTAHTSVIGLLNMRAMTAAANDPLIHTDQDLIDDLCRTYRDAATRGE